MSADLEVVLTLWIALAACTQPPATLGSTDKADTDVDADADSDSDADTDITTTTSATTTTATTTTTTLLSTVRVVTWNLESVGSPGSMEYEAARAVLARIDADVVALNEVDGFELAYLDALAADLGYATVVVAPDNPFGWLRNAILTRLPVATSTIWTSAVLSGDPAANDVTRLPLSIEVQTAAGTLCVVSEHWKSGFDVIDEFRRVVESVRVGQATLAASTTAVLAMGDLNAEVGEVGVTPTWYYVPVDAPSDFELGADLQASLDGAGIENDVFVHLDEVGLVRVPARQRDGNLATRDVSGRIIDHVFATGSVQVLGSEVYDARDEGLQGLVLSGVAPASSATADASDHLPVFVDVALWP